MTTDQLIAAIAGALISLIATLMPSFHALPAARKQLVMAGAMLAVALSSFGWSCWANAEILALPDVPCDLPGLADILAAFLTALMANQSTYLVTRARQT